MSIAITDDHRALARTASDFLSKYGARGAARALLEAEADRLPDFWTEMGNLGWLGLHLPEKYDGSGFGLAWRVLAAGAVGVARGGTEQAAEYAKVREQFGRPIATFQAVKHHCANMLVAAEQATAAVWDAARAAAGGGDQLSYTAAIAAALAVPAASLDADLNIPVHGGVGFTWEHDAHLYLRRATAIEAIIDTETAAIQVTDSVRKGVRRERAIDLPTEAEPIREVVREFIGRIRDLGEDARRKAMIEAGYVMPNWPKPWGRDAGAVEQLVIEQEFAAAGIRRPSYGITSWVILTLIQYGTAGQVERWVGPALNQEMIWCQLFSER